MMLKEEPGTFAADVDKTLTALGSAAKTVVGKFGAAKKKAEDDIKKANDAATRQAAKNKKATEKGQNQKSSSPVANQIRTDLAHFLLALPDLPVMDSMRDWDDLDASQFQDLVAELRKVEDGLLQFQKAYSTLLKGSSFLTANEKLPSSFNMVFQSYDEAKDINILKASIAENPDDLHKAIIAVFYDPTLATTGRAVMNWLIKRSAKNAEFNNRKAMTEIRPTGLTLARIFYAYIQQVMVPRIEAMSNLVEQYENKPITQEHLTALRGLLKRL